MKAIDQLFEAQKIAFSPFVFQTVYSLLELNVLATINEHRKGITLADLEASTNVSEYGLGVLLEMAVCADIVSLSENKTYQLTKLGYFLLRDEMTRANFMFTQHVCYNGLFHLKEAIEKGEPAGLKVFGNWKTVYEGLSSLPENVKKAWFDFDHYYSDKSFQYALEIIFQNKPKMIFDIGGNTGKWAIASTKYDPTVEVTMFDLPGQLAVAKETIGKLPDISSRVNYHEINVLEEESVIPAGADVYWMSQFLDCFSATEIESILLKVRQNCSENATVYIMETFTNDQKFPASEYSLVATSLYFTAIANGNSKMYSSEIFKYIVEKAGFKCVAEHKLHTDSFHTILEVKPV